MSDKTIEELLIEHQDIPAIRNNGGGFRIIAFFGKL